MRYKYVPGQNGMDPASPFCLETDNPGHDALELAEKELRETPACRKEATEELRKLLREDKEVYFRDDDEILLTFLRPTKFYPKSALQLMKAVADFKETYASVLKDLTPESERTTFLDNRVVNVLVDRDQHGRRILIAHVGELWNTSNVTSDSLFRVFYLIHLAALIEPECQIRGVVVILDFKGLGYKQVKTMSYDFSKMLLTFIQEAMPLRLKEVHIVNQPILFNCVWPIFKLFLDKKLEKRLRKHGSNKESLHEYLGKDHLPQDYGGTKPKIDYSSADWYPVLCSLNDHVAEWQTFGKRKRET